MNARPESLQHQSSFLWHPEEEEQGEGGADHRPGGMVDFIDTDTSDSIDKCTLHSVLCTLIPLTPSQATTLMTNKIIIDFIIRATSERL